jgi:NADPH-dependent 2,4-dienoyl-CoA reductase/sulfur reductase-like enzyme
MAPGVLFGSNIAGDKHEFDPDLWTSSISPVKNETNGTDGTNGTHVANGRNGATQKNGSTTHSKLPNRHPETGIDVLIVGAGMGGLMATLECWRKGHNIVGILERNNGPVYSGAYHPAYLHR